MNRKPLRPDWRIKPPRKMITGMNGHGFQIGLNRLQPDYIILYRLSGNCSVLTYHYDGMVYVDTDQWEIGKP